MKAAAAEAAVYYLESSLNWFNYWDSKHINQKGFFFLFVCEFPENHQKLCAVSLAYLFKKPAPFFPYKRQRAPRKFILPLRQEFAIFVCKNWKSPAVPEARKKGKEEKGYLALLWHALNKRKPFFVLSIGGEIFRVTTCLFPKSKEAGY